MIKVTHELANKFKATLICETFPLQKPGPLYGVLVLLRFGKALEWQSPAGEAGNSFHPSSVQSIARQSWAEVEQ